LTIEIHPEVMNDILFTQIKIGSMHLPNRLIMAPLTRSRATIDGIPTAIMAKYYAQRASAGLIISEATNISIQGTGYPYTPGIYSIEQIKKWKDVTHAVHEAGGRIFMQLWHVGRHSHPWYQIAGDPPISASAILEEGSIKTPDGIKETVTPRSLEISEIEEVVKQYGQAADNAIEAGFDGVEIHGANGYLIDQFIQDGTNKRTDEYGGSIENRSRFLFEVVKEVISRISADKTGLRLSPSGIKLDMSDMDPVGTFSYVVKKLNEYNLAYLHLLEPLEDVSHLSHYLNEVTSHFRKIYKGTLITNGGFNAESGNNIIADGHADLVAYGKAFISNPDLVEKYKKGKAITPWNVRTFYTQGEEGYVDY
jgi:N-ethylmaleimide reductase